MSKWMADEESHASHCWSGNLQRSKRKAFVTDVVTYWSWRHKYELTFSLLIGRDCQKEKYV